MFWLVRESGREDRHRGRADCRDRGLSVLEDLDEILETGQIGVL